MITSSSAGERPLLLIKLIDATMKEGKRIGTSAAQSMSKSMSPHKSSFRTCIRVYKRSVSCPSLRSRQPRALHLGSMRSHSGSGCSTSTSSNRPFGVWPIRTSFRVSASGNVRPSSSSGNGKFEPEVIPPIRAQQQQTLEQQQTIEQRGTNSPSSSEGRHPLASGWSSMRPPTSHSFQRDPSDRDRAPAISPFDSQRIGIGDRRLLGLFDSRFHSTSRWGWPAYGTGTRVAMLPCDDKGLALMPRPRRHELGLRRCISSCQAPIDMSL